MAFHDRADAGQQLAEAVRRSCPTENLVVLGLPRGGVPVAAQVAEALGAPLDVLVVRKLGVPFQPELAMGAIGEGGVRVENADVLRSAALGELDLRVAEDREQVELERRARQYRGGRPRLDLHGRNALIVDDGIATGSTARAACEVARASGAARVVVATPVASRLAVVELSRLADDVVCVESPDPFYAVGEWYWDFSQTSDSDVVDLLRRSSGQRPDRTEPEPGALRREEVVIRDGGVALAGLLTVPDTPIGTVVFAHGSGSGRRSPRHRHVAAVLNEGRLATLLMDLLTADEEAQRGNVFDVRLLAARVADTTRWVKRRPELADTKLGLFGASTGAAAALWAAAQPDAGVSAVVSRGGRPDLAAPMLARVSAPTLLLVGGADETVLALNRSAQAELGCPNRMIVIPGAGHLFEEPGALEAVAQHARNWFACYLGPRPSPDGAPPTDV